MRIPRDLQKKLFDLYVVFVLFLSTQAFLTLFVGGQGTSTTSQGSPVLKLAWGLVYVISILRLIGKREKLYEIVKANKPLVFLIGLAVASMLWSIDKSSTLHAASSLVLSALFAADLSLTYPIERQLKLACVALAIAVVLSVVVETLTPGLIPGSDIEESAWHGLFGFKNDFGKVICLGTVTALAVLRRSKLLQTLVVLAAIGLAVLSRSAGALGYTSLMTLVFMGWSILKWRPKPRKVATAALIFLGVVSGYYVSQNMVEVTGLFGKDPHLTGRTELWRLAVEDIEAKPVLGYGFQAFWNQDSQPARRIREAINWQDAPHAHDGFIDFGLNFGLVGLIGYAILYVTVFRKAAALFVGGEEGYRRWPLTLFALTFIYQFIESGFFSGNTISWILFCSTAFSLSAIKVSSAVRRPVIYQMPAAS